MARPIEIMARVRDEVWRSAASSLQARTHYILRDLVRGFLWDSVRKLMWTKRISFPMQLQISDDDD